MHSALKNPPAILAPVLLLIGIVSLLQRPACAEIKASWSSSWPFSPCWFLLAFLLVMKMLADFPCAQSYVVYLGAHSHGREGAALAANQERARSSHYQFLGSVLGSEEKAQDAIFYFYTKYINGFAATLEEEYAMEISKEWPEALKNSLGRLWSMYHEASDKRIEERLENAKLFQELVEDRDKFKKNYYSLMDDVDKFMKDQEKRVMEANLKKMNAEKEAIFDLDRPALEAEVIKLNSELFDLKEEKKQWESMKKHWESMEKLRKENLVSLPTLELLGALNADCLVAGGAADDCLGPGAAPADCLGPGGGPAGCLAAGGGPAGCLVAGGGLAGCLGAAGATSGCLAVLVVAEVEEHPLFLLGCKY
ncbi:hypothetical protein ACQ4PT_010602 [Festuca glaucescens]